MDINHNQSTPKLSKCDGDVLTFSDLDCNDTYKISVYWRSPISNTVRCLVDGIYDLSPQCDVVQERNLLWLTFVIPVVLPFLCITITVVGFVCCNKYLGKNDYAVHDVST